MPNASDEIHNGILTHTVNLLRVAAGQRLKVLSMLEALENKLVADLNTVVGKTPNAVSRLQALLKQTQATIATAYKAIADNQGAALSKIAQLEAVKTVNVLNTALKVPLVSVGHTPAQLAAIAGKTFVQGKHPNEWWKAQDKALQDKFTTAMREGMLKGEPIDKLVQRVRGTKAAAYTDGIMLASKAQAEALVRTSVITVANEARIAEIMGQGGVVKGIQWVATLDSRTTVICRALDGKQWTVPELKPVDHDKLFPGPTAHWQCRSTQIPVTRSWAELAGPNSKLKNTAGIEGNYAELLAKKMEAAGIKGPAIDQAMAAAKVKLDGNGTSGTVTFESWLKTKSDAEVDQILGPGKGKLWREGKVTISQMTDQSNRPLSLAELHAMVGADALAPVAKEGDGGLTLQQRKLLEQSMAHGVQTGKVLAHYVDADTGELVAAIEGTGLTTEQVLKLQAVKRLHVFQNSLETGEVWSEAQLGMFGKLQGFQRATLVGPTGRPVTVQVKPGATFNQENAKGLWAQFQALKQVKTIPQTQQKFISAAAKEGTLKVTLGKADEVKLPPGTFNQQFPELLVKPAPFHDPVAEQAAAAKAVADAEAAATAQAVVDAAKAKAEEAHTAKLVELRAAEAQANADAYQARAEATDALKAADVAQAAAEAQAAAVKVKNEAAQQEIADVLANPTGKTLLAKSLATVMKEQPSLPPAELLEQAKTAAAQAQAKASAAAALSGYKKKALAGEEPTPAQKKALETMDAEAKGKFLAGIQAIKDAAAAAIAKAAAEAAAKLAAEQAAAAEALAKAAEAAAAKKAAKAAATKAANKAKKATVATPIPTTPQPTLPVAPVAEAAFPATPSATKVVKKLGGSTGAELVSDPATGELYVRKKGASADHLREEMTADRIYGLMGAPTPAGRLYETAAGPVKLTSYLGDDATTLDNFFAVAAPAEKAAVVAQLQRHFVLDALLGNWDVIGLSGDNVLVARDLTAFRVDNGGSLRFKAMGGKKPAAQFGPSVLELESMRDASVNPKAAPIFKGVTEAQMREQTVAIVSRRDEILATLPPEIRDVVGQRIDYLAKRFSVAAVAPEPAAPAGVPADLPAKAVKARLNGHGVLGDGGDVEDLHALVWEEKDAAGQPQTRINMKLTLAGSQKLVNHVGEAKLNSAPLEAGVTLGSTPSATNTNVHPQDTHWPSLLAAAKTVSQHAGDGQYNASTIATFHATAAKLAQLLADKSLDAQGKAMVQQYMDYVGKIGTAMNDKKALPAGSMKQFLFVPSKATTAAPANNPDPVGMQVFKTTKQWIAKDITNGFAKETAGTAGSAESGSAQAPAYKFKFGPDVEVRFIRPSGSVDSQEALAMQGQVEITVKAGASVASIAKAHDAMRELGIDLSPPTPEMQELVYLRRGVYLLAKKNVPAFDAIVNGADPEPVRVAKAKEFIKSRFGVDLPAKPSADYNPAGRPMSSFGDGHLVWERWDMPRAKVEKEMKGYVLTHHFSRSIPDALDGILNSGGELTPTVQRLRKGVSLGATGGMSASADISTGGASYFFTRIRTNAAAGSGLRLKIRNLARLDTVSYSDDVYGRISNIGNRKNSVAEWKQVARNSSNETLFKHGLNLLDEIDSIKTSGPSERKLVLDVFKKHGITVLPDGRKIEDVVT